MDIKDYFNVLWRRKWIIILTAIVALIVAVVGTSLIRPTYQASTILRVAASAGGPLNYTASTYSNQLINTTAQIAASRPILTEMAVRLKLSEPPDVTAEVIPQTELIKITVEYYDSKMAAQIANTLANMLIVQSNELYTGGSLESLDVLAQQIDQYKTDLNQTRQEYDTLLALTPPAPEKATVTLDLLQLKERTYEAMLQKYSDALLQQEVRANMMTVIEEATIPKAPIKPQATYNYVLGLVLGLFGGVVLAFIAEGFDSTLYSAKEIETISTLPVLAKIPKVSRREVQMSVNEVSSLAEAFRALALNILLTEQQRPEKVLLITGAEPKQGKSTVTANLSIALAEYGKTVVAVDCDMRLPNLHERFHLSNKSGLKNILEGTSDIESELKHPAEGISILTSGPHPANPSQLLGSPHMAKVIEILREQFDFVLLDTPALLAVSDTAAIVQNMELAQNVNAFMLVVRQSHAQRGQVQAASKFLKGFPGKCAGIVINHAGDVAGYYYYRVGKNGRRAKASERVQTQQ